MSFLSRPVLRICQLVLWGGLLTTAASAAPAPADTASQAAAMVLPVDTAAPGPLRALDAGRLRELRGQREFQYVEPELEEDNNSAWSQFWWKLWQWLRELFSGPGYEHGGRYAVYALFGGAFLYALLRLLRLDLTGLLGRRARAVPLPYEAAPEDIHGVNFAGALAEAETAGNYRLAVRLGYLLVLRHLTERGLIRWQPDKTNHEYLLELAGTPWAAGFRELTRQFELVWYGELPLPPAAYPALRDTRQAFLHHLTRAAA